MKFLEWAFYFGIVVILLVAGVWVGASVKPVQNFFSELNAYVAIGADTEEKAFEVLWKTLPPDNNAGLSAKSIRMNRQSAEKYLFAEQRGNQTGINYYDQKKAYNGVTVYSNHTTEAVMIDMEGNILHKWNLPFNKVWPDPKHVFKPQASEDTIYWVEARPQPNGDIYVIYVRPYALPWGYGLAKLNKDSEVIWKFTANAHHWLDISPDGKKVYVLEQQKDAKIYPALPDAKYPIIKDFVTVLDSATGEILDRISIVDAFNNSDYRALFKFIADDNSDILHTNEVEYITAEHAANMEFANEGDLLVSFKAINAIAIIDKDTKIIKWADLGLWKAQHDPDALPNGNFLVFDNLNHVGEGGQSRVIEYNPHTKEIVWKYAGAKGDELFSKTRGMQELLPNNNVLIVESDSSRMFEVTRDGEIVWEFYNPVRLEGSPDRVGTISAGRRYAKEYFNFLQ